MLTIPMMVRVGAWTVKTVEVVEPREHCEVCDTSIKEVWVCEVDAPTEKLVGLRGQRAWRLGNECGPRLMSLSENQWADPNVLQTVPKHAVSYEAERPSKEVRIRLQRGRRYLALRAKAAAENYDLPDHVRDLGEELLNGTLGAFKLKRFGMLMTDHERALELRD